MTNGENTFGRVPWIQQLQLLRGIASISEAVAFYVFITGLTLWWCFTFSLGGSVLLGLVFLGLFIGMVYPLMRIASLEPGRPLLAAHRLERAQEEELFSYFDNLATRLGLQSPADIRVDLRDDLSFSHSPRGSQLTLGLRLVDAVDQQQLTEVVVRGWALHAIRPGSFLLALAATLEAASQRALTTIQQLNDLSTYFENRDPIKDAYHFTIVPKVLMALAVSMVQRGQQLLKKAVMQELERCEKRAAMTGSTTPAADLFNDFDKLMPQYEELVRWHEGMPGSQPKHPWWQDSKGWKSTAFHGGKSLMSLLAGAPETLGRLRQLPFDRQQLRNIAGALLSPIFLAALILIFPADSFIALAVPLLLWLASALTFECFRRGYKSNSAKRQLSALISWRFLFAAQRAKEFAVFGIYVLATLAANGVVRWWFERSTWLELSAGPSAFLGGFLAGLLALGLTPGLFLVVITGLGGNLTLMARPRQHLTAFLACCAPPWGLWMRLAAAMPALALPTVLMTALLPSPWRLLVAGLLAVLVLDAAASLGRLARHHKLPLQKIYEPDLVEDDGGAQSALSCA